MWATMKSIFDRLPWWIWAGIAGALWLWAMSMMGGLIGLR
jgi:hypothetical protein